MENNELINSILSDIEETRKLIQKYLKMSYKGNNEEREKAKYTLKYTREIFDLRCKLLHEKDIYKLILYRKNLQNIMDSVIIYK